MQWSRRLVQIGQGTITISRPGDGEASEEECYFPVVLLNDGKRIRLRTQKFYDELYFDGLNSNQKSRESYPKNTFRSFS